MTTETKILAYGIILVTIGLVIYATSQRHSNFYYQAYNDCVADKQLSTLFDCRCLANKAEKIEQKYGINGIVLGHADKDLDDLADKSSIVCLKR